jgi:hypothetical protein
VFAKDNTADQALAFPVCKGPDCRDARTEMPGLPVWAWMPGSFGGNMREPSLAEMSALYYSALAEGIRGCLLTSYHPVSPENPAAPADETGQPGPLLLAMKPMLQKFGKMGRMLLPYEVNDNLRCEASGKAYAGVYSGQDGLAKHVMLASKDVANKQTVLLGFTPGTPAPTQLRDALDGSVISVVVKDGLATGTVDIDAADSRLLEVVRAGANAAAERPAASSARETAPKTPTTAPAAADRAAHHHAGTTPCGP